MVFTYSPELASLTPQSSRLRGRQTMPMRRGSGNEEASKVGHWTCMKTRVPTYYYKQGPSAWRLPTPRLLLPPTNAPSLCPSLDAFSPSSGPTIIRYFRSNPATLQLNWKKSALLSLVHSFNQKFLLQVPVILKEMVVLVFILVLGLGKRYYT